MNVEKESVKSEQLKSMNFEQESVNYHTIKKIYTRKRELPV